MSIRMAVVKRGSLTNVGVADPPLSVDSQEKVVTRFRVEVR